MVVAADVQEGRRVGMSGAVDDIGVAVVDVDADESSPTHDDEAVSDEEGILAQEEGECVGGAGADGVVIAH